MKGKTSNKLLVIAVTVLLAAVTILPGMTGLRVNAVNKYTALTLQDSQDPSKPLEIPFSKVLDMPDTAVVPSAGFSFEIKPGDPIDAKDEKLAVLAGPVKAGYPQIASVVFAAGEKKDDKTVSGTKTSCTKTTSIKFDGVEFTEPGVYRYKITEKNTDGYNNIAIGTDTDDLRILDIYIIDDNGVLKYGGYTITKAKSTDSSIPAPVKSDTVIDLTNKSDMFINKYPTAGLTFGKEVTGNQGSKDKYFKFTLSITKGVPNTIMSVNYSKADATIQANPNDATKGITADITQPANITLNNAGEATVDFYLQDGQYITVNGFTENMEYALKEEKKDYEQTKGITAEDSSFDYDGKAGNDALNDGAALNANGEITGVFAIQSGEVASQYTGFTNRKNGAIPTGVIMSVAPWVIAGIVILAGIIFFAIRSRRKIEEE